MRRLVLIVAVFVGCADRTLGGGDGDGSSGSGGVSEVTSDGDPTPTSGPSTVTVTTADPSSPGTISTTVSATDPEPTTATVTSSPPNPTSVSISVSATDPTSDTDITATGSDTDGFCNDPFGQPNDAPCTDGSGCGCASGKCFVVPILGGFCGECLADADCSPGGCTIPDPINGEGSHCNKGEPGAGCESDAVCSDPQHAHCAAVLEVENIIKVATCGACGTNGDCPPAAHNCTPIYDIVNFGGVFECLPDGVVPDGGGCNLNEPNGGEACASGHCGEANVMGLLFVGICGECNSNADCQPGQICSEPLVDLDQGVLVPAQCQ